MAHTSEVADGLAGGVRYTLEDDELTWNFLYQFTRDPEQDFVEKFRGPPLFSMKLWQKFIDETGSQKTWKQLANRFVFKSYVL